MPCTGECKSKAKPGETADMADLDGDEVWASDEEGVSVYADRQRAQVSQGYLDGITSAQELGLQYGFDKGYPEGANLGIRVGRILATLYGTDQFETAKRELNIIKVLDRKYYDDLLDVKESDHPLVVHWEKEAKLTQS